MANARLPRQLNPLSVLAIIREGSDLVLMFARPDPTLPAVKCWRVQWTGPPGGCLATMFLRRRRVPLRSRWYKAYECSGFRRVWGRVLAGWLAFGVRQQRARSVALEGAGSGRGSANSTEDATTDMYAARDTGYGTSNGSHVATNSDTNTGPFNGESSEHNGGSTATTTNTSATGIPADPFVDSNGSTAAAVMGRSAYTDIDSDWDGDDDGGDIDVAAYLYASFEALATMNDRAPRA